MDYYDAGFICNHSDHNGRYAFNQQPYIGLWNLSCLAQTLLPLAPKEELQTVLDTYMPALTAHYQRVMRTKLGLVEEDCSKRL
jgi:protein adenylyltransferase